MYTYKYIYIHVRVHYYTSIYRTANIFFCLLHIWSKKGRKKAIICGSWCDVYIYIYIHICILDIYIYMYTWCMRAIRMDSFGGRRCHGDQLLTSGVIGGGGGKVGLVLYPIGMCFQYLLFMIVINKKKS